MSKGFYRELRCSLPILARLCYAGLWAFLLLPLASLAFPFILLLTRKVTRLSKKEGKE